MQDVGWDHYPRVARTPSARAWILYLTKLQKKPKTVDAYARGIEDLIAFCERTRTSLTQMTRGDIAEYLNDMHQRPHPRGASITHIQAGVGLAPATIQQRLTAVRLFQEYLLDTQVRTDGLNPVGRGRYVARGSYGSGTYGQRGLYHTRPSQPWIPGDDQWTAFLDVVLREERLRNQAMVLLAYEGALRRQEVVSLRVSDIDWAHQQITIRPEVSKNGHSRVVFYSAGTSMVLAAYLQGDRRYVLTGSGGVADGPLFLSESHRSAGQPLSKDAWNDIVQSVARRADLPQFHPHTFRHLRLTHYARCELELYEIALLAGHQSLDSTRMYIHMTATELGRRMRVATQSLSDRIQRHIHRTREREHDTEPVGDHA